jgi:hypothetical protein
VILSALTFAAAMIAAPGEIYRCVGADGKASFQDRPCAAAAHAARLERGAVGNPESERELRAWLDKLRRESGAPRSTTPPAASSPDAMGRRAPHEAQLTDTETRQLAACSERFLDCANGDATRMDRCVAQMPRCSASGVSACCPAACISRYASLRHDGASLAGAVRNALLGESEPSCAARAVTSP